ncbi:MAG: phenylacetic acid degradation bifunctional protein PaaZ [Sandaracinaceae bacterium]
MRKVRSFARGEWVEGRGAGRTVRDAATGAPVAAVTSEGLDVGAMTRFARDVGGPRLRAMTFHERAAMLRGLAKALDAAKDELGELSARAGATREDSRVDVDGGIGTLFVYSSKGRRELPGGTVLVDGDLERTSRRGTFVGQHVKVPRRGVAVHINAFNFPCWGMLEKLAPTLLAGMPAIVKPASVTSYVAEQAFAVLVGSGLLPEGALQLISGSVGDLFTHLDGQDVVTFTGSAATGRQLRGHPRVLERNVRFNLEADSLNVCLLGPDGAPGTPEFDLFVKEVAEEMRIKAGQRCTAIRRALVPRPHLGAAVEALRARLAEVPIGDPRRSDVRMGPLVGLEQRDEVRAAVAALRSGAEVVAGGQPPEVLGADPEAGAFLPLTLLRCDRPLEAQAPHEVEAFGPVSTLMPYDDLAEAGAIIRRGGGSLVGTVVTADPSLAVAAVGEIGAHHGRLHLLNRHCEEESTGHGSPLPHLVHGGPGRAGGGEELGGLRALDLYLQRTALQGTPGMLSRVAGTYLPGAPKREVEVHPFRRTYDELAVGDTLFTHRRTVTEADIVAFAGITGDFFYAHMDEVAARKSPLFGGRVAHGYFVLSAAAGLFVHPAEGPVLANYGLEGLRFTKPVRAGDTIRAELTVKRKTPRATKGEEPPQGVVEWHVDVLDQEDDLVATYTILTVVRRGAA